MPPLFHFACQKPNGLTMAVLSIKRREKKSAFLVWSKLEVNYKQRQICLSFSWVRKIKATLIPDLSPWPSNSWESYQLTCLCSVVFPLISTAGEGHNQHSFSRKACSLHHVPTTWKNVTSVLCSSQEDSRHHSLLEHGSSCCGSSCSSSTSSSRPLAGEKKGNWLHLSRN